MKFILEKFLECGDYTKGITRIKYTNKDINYEYFRPFSCKSWCLCPSGNHKRLLLFSEHLSGNVLLKLPHRQFLLPVPKLLGSYFKYDRNLFEEVSNIIYSIIQVYYVETEKTRVKTGVIVS